MLKELSLLKWKEKATKLASDDAISRVAQCQDNVANLEKNLASERLFVTDEQCFFFFYITCFLSKHILIQGEDSAEFSDCEGNGVYLQ